jgi:hypothetical protein
LASSPPSQPESCGCEKFFLTARDFFSDICQVGSWESTCLLYAATSTVGKEDSRLNSPADKLFLPLFFLVDRKYFLIIWSTNLVDQIYLNAFRWIKFLFTFFGPPNFFLYFLVHQIHIFYIFWWTNFIWTLFGGPNFSLLFLVHQIHIFYVFWSTNFIFIMFLVHKFHFYVFCPSNSYFSLFLVHKINLNVFGGPN